jgi:flavin-dependent dehydrogenase
VFPKREHLSVGCLSTRKVAGGLRQQLDEYLRRVGVDRVEEREDHGYAIPVAPRRERARGRVLLVGDAAGLADPVTCEGITHAALSARLAARAVAEGLDDARRVRRGYERALARELLGELRRARLLAWLLYERPRWRTALFRRAGAGLCEAMAAVIAGEASYGSLLLRPRNHLALLARLARPRPGARAGAGEGAADPRG